MTEPRKRVDDDNDQSTVHFRIWLAVVLLQRRVVRKRLLETLDDYYKTDDVEERVE